MSEFNQKSRKVELAGYIYILGELFQGTGLPNSGGWLDEVKKSAAKALRQGSLELSGMVEAVVHRQNLFFFQEALVLLSRHYNSSIQIV